MLVRGSPLTVYRYYQDPDRKLGEFYTTERYASASEAAVRLGLPYAPRFVAEAQVNPGTLIFQGTAAMFPGRVGGGPQVFIPRDALTNVKIIKEEAIK
jgi:hypothetical protein